MGCGAARPSRSTTCFPRDNVYAAVQSPVSQVSGETTSGRPKSDTGLELAKDPLSNRQVKRLVGTGPLLRLRVGDFRVVFSIEQEELLILIIAIGSRGEIYRRL